MDPEFVNILLEKALRLNGMPAYTDAQKEAAVALMCAKGNELARPPKAVGMLSREHLFVLAVMTMADVLAAAHALSERSEVMTGEAIEAEMRAASHAAALKYLANLSPDDPLHTWLESVRSRPRN
jgi:hypothetical protein